ncbi:MAG: hypothetical protein ABI405_04635 [Parafilimonas sp.]
MNTRKHNFWFIAKPLLLMNIGLFVLIMVIHSATKKPERKEEPCNAAKKINADVLNSISVKLM